MENFDGYIADIYREMEAELIASMKRNLGLHQAEEALTGLKYPQWQAIKLKELMRFQRENERIMGEKLSGLPDEVSKHMIEELNQGSKHELKRYRKALKKGYKSAVTMKDSFFHVNDRKVQGMINALNNDLARANSAVLRMMNDQYRQTIFKAGMFVSNGVYTEEQAVKKAVEEFEKKGLNCIEYKDGRRVNIADYASMAVRTANQRAYMVGEGEFRKSIGETLVIISRHSTSCDLCKPFEGKVLIDDVYSGGTQEDGDYMLLSEAMAQGLYHPRCRHGLGTYYPELEDINGYETEDNKLNDYGSKENNFAHIDAMIEKYKQLVTESSSSQDTVNYAEKLNYWENQKQYLVDKIKQNDILISKRLKITQIRASSITEKINSGEYSTKMSEQHYLKHIEGTPQHKSYIESRIAKGGNPQSVLTIDAETAQKLIIERAGTGIVRTSHKGIAKPIEDIDCGFVVGKYFGNGEYHNTTKFSIHYGKKSSHIVPIRGDNFG